MNRRELLISGMGATIVAASAAPAAAPAGGADPIGSYFGTVTATDPPLGEFTSLISFHTGGVLTESRRYLVPGTPLGNLLEITGHGAWRRTGGHTLEAFFRFLLQNADTGSPVATDNVRLWLTVDRHSGTLSGRFQSQIKDLADNLLLTVTGDYAASPIVV